MKLLDTGFVLSSLDVCSHREVEQQCKERAEASENSYIGNSKVLCISAQDQNVLILQYLIACDNFIAKTQ